jgi:hypothetical protein
MRTKHTPFILTLTLGFFAAGMAHAWVPDTRIDLSLPDNCRPEFLEDGLLSKRGDLPELEKFANEYFARCEFAFRRRSHSTWLTMMSMSNLEYSFEDRPGIKKVEFVDQQDGVVRPGYLALQPGDRRRPLIIFQCGVLCNLKDASMKTILIGLYDTGVFHILVLPSSTGSEYQKQNGILALGGVDEGRQLMRIGLMLKSSGFPYSNRVSDIHLIGASLGGHSALYGSLYADYYERANHRKVFDSVMAACPVVKLQESIENITRKSIVGRFFYSNFVSQLLDVFDDIPVLKSLIPRGRGFKPKYAELREIIANGALDYYKNRTRDPHWGLPPLQDTRIATLEDLWKTNNFVDYGYGFKRNPLFIWTSKDDPVVRYDQNSGVLISRDKEVEGHKIFSLVMPRGNHCMYEASYGWQTAGALFRGYFLSQSPEFARSRRRTNLQLEPARIPAAFRLASDEKRVSAFWQVDEKTKAVNLVTNIRRKECWPEGRVHNTVCNRKSLINFSYAELNIATVPKNRPELLALERRLNTNYRLYQADGHYLSELGTPSRIEMLNY